MSQSSGQLYSCILSNEVYLRSCKLESSKLILIVIFSRRDFSPSRCLVEKRVSVVCFNFPETHTGSVNSVKLRGQPDLQGMRK